MGAHDPDRVTRNLRDQTSAIARLAQRLEKAVALGMVPEGWHCQWCLETAAIEIRSALDRPHEQTSDPFPRARGV